VRVLHLTTEFPPVIWGGLGTAVGGIVNASTRADMTVGVLLVGGFGSAPEMERAWLAGPLLPYRDKIQFKGWLPPADVMRCYARADVLVVPSWYEPFGMVVLEGMLYGLAIAAAAVGGPAEILQMDVTGLLFAPRDVGALTETLVRLVRDAGLRRALGAAAAAEVRRQWL
jgi:glycosyltransferase involved in cell wall biosynthesis